MTKIFLVKQNLKHNGTDYKIGQLVQDEFEAMPNLVNDGVLRIIEGAENIGEAESILEKEKEEAGDQESAEVAQQPENTWGPKKDEPEEVKPEEKKKGFLGRILGGKKEDDTDLTPEAKAWIALKDEALALGVPEFTSNTTSEELQKMIDDKKAENANKTPGEVGSGESTPENKDNIDGANL